VGEIIVTATPGEGDNLEAGTSITPWVAREAFCCGGRDVRRKKSQRPVEEDRAGAP
jgi:hypothetical protein